MPPGLRSGAQAPSRRHRILVFALILAVASGVTGWVLAAGASSQPRQAQLVVERTVGRTGFAEILASVDPGDGARAPRAGDRVRLRCDDGAGTSLLDAEGRLTVDGGGVLAHLHFAMTPAKLGAVVTCVAAGDGVVLRGTVARR